MGRIMLFEENIEQATNPKFEEFDKEWKPVHDWRTYVTDGIRQEWFNLDIEPRCIIIHIAQECADKEHWN